MGTPKKMQQAYHREIHITQFLSRFSVSPVLSINATSPLNPGYGCLALVVHCDCVPPQAPQPQTGTGLQYMSRSASIMVVGFPYCPCLFVCMADPELAMKTRTTLSVKALCQVKTT